MLKLCLDRTSRFEFSLRALSWTNRTRRWRLRLIKFESARLRVEAFK